jgi:hypothetical protein
VSTSGSFVILARSLGLVTLAVVWLGASFGCGTKASNFVKISGVVTLEGVPLEGAKVTYYPSSGEGPSLGVTDARGRFELSTFDMKTRKSMDGALPGDYKVTVEMPSPGGGRNPAEAMEAEHMKGRARPKAAGKEKEATVLHANYTDVSKTPLKQLVPPQGAVELKLTKSGT